MMIVVWLRFCCLIILIVLFVILLIIFWCFLFSWLILVVSFFVLNEFFDMSKWIVGFVCLICLMVFSFGVIWNLIVFLFVFLMFLFDSLISFFKFSWFVWWSFLSFSVVINLFLLCNGIRLVMVLIVVKLSSLFGSLFNKVWVSLNVILILVSFLNG